MTYNSPENQYLNGLSKIFYTGVDIPNLRTRRFCRTAINIDMVYDASTNSAPILTTRKTNPKIAIAELLGYIRGVTSAKDMRDLGTKTWDSNANENGSWIKNPHRQGEDDLGMIYGAVAKNWPIQQTECPSGGPTTDLFHKVYNNLRNGIDDRGEIITFWNPGLFHLGCLRPCMYEHQFSLIGDDLYLNSTQRSSDWALGTVSNMVQAWLFLRLMAQITDKNPKLAFHKNVNCHLYENQLESVETQLDRDILDTPTIDINPDIKTLVDLENATLDDFKITYDSYHPPIKYPFAI